MRNHKKVKALRNKFGQVLGYAFWAMFVEYLTEQDGNELEDSEIELEMFAGELGVSVTEIQSMVDYCCKIELLFINPDGFIYSESLNENLEPVFEKRKKSKEISRTRKRRENGQFTEKEHQDSGVSVAEKPQSRVEDSIVEESRVDNAISDTVVAESPKTDISTVGIQQEKINDCLKRMGVFRETLKSFLHRYPESMLADFYDFWKERNKSKTKMRFEQEKSWDLASRLRRWEKNMIIRQTKQDKQDSTPSKTEKNISVMNEILNEIAKEKTVPLKQLTNG